MKEKVKSTAHFITSDNYLSRGITKMSDRQLVGFYKWMLKNERIKPDGAAAKRMEVLEHRAIENLHQDRMNRNHYYAKIEEQSH